MDAPDSARPYLSGTAAEAQSDYLGQIEYTEDPFAFINFDQSSGGPTLEANIDPRLLSGGPQQSPPDETLNAQATLEDAEIERDVKFSLAGLDPSEMFQPQDFASILEDPIYQRQMDDFFDTLPVPTPLPAPELDPTQNQQLLDTGAPSSWYSPVTYPDTGLMGVHEPQVAFPYPGMYCRSLSGRVFEVIGYPAGFVPPGFPPRAQPQHLPPVSQTSLQSFQMPMVRPRSRKPATEQQYQMLRMPTGHQKRISTSTSLSASSCELYPGHHGKKVRMGRGRQKSNESENKYSPEKVYKEKLEPVVSWGTRHDGSGHKFTYSVSGQWHEHLSLTAEDLHEYIKHCPRELKLWLQQCPAQSNSRVGMRVKKCRYAHCPIGSKTILAGWLRVAFDEFPHLTTTGRKDPFKVAGVMHLWCFEQCMDPLGLLRNRKMAADDRNLPREERNPMALNRDTDRNIVRAGLDLWIRHAEKEATCFPRAHPDSLSYALVKYHVDHQVQNRQLTRDRRNADRPVWERNTQDVHFGDLVLYAQISHMRKNKEKEGYTQQHFQDVLNGAWSKPIEQPAVDGESYRSIDLTSDMNNSPVNITSSQQFKRDCSDLLMDTGSIEPFATSQAPLNTMGFMTPPSPTRPEAGLDTQAIPFDFTPPGLPTSTSVQKLQFAMPGQPVTPNSSIKDKSKFAMPGRPASLNGSSLKRTSLESNSRLSSSSSMKKRMTPDSGENLDEDEDSLFGSPDTKKRRLENESPVSERGYQGSELRRSHRLSSRDSQSN